MTELGEGETAKLFDGDVEGLLDKDLGDDAKEGRFEAELFALPK